MKGLQRRYASLVEARDEMGNSIRLSAVLLTGLLPGNSPLAQPLAAVEPESHGRRVLGWLD